MALKLTKEQKVEIFKDLTSKTLYDVAVKHGFDKHYSKEASAKNAVYRIYGDIRNNPEKYNIEQETVDLVVENVSGRKVAPVPNQTKIAERIDGKDIKSLLTGARDKSAKLILEKLEHSGGSKAALANTSLSQLGTIFGILFDKSQIIQGMATEHVAHMGRIDSNLSPEDKMDLILKMREQTVIEKNG